MQKKILWLGAIACALIGTGCGGATDSTVLGTASNPRIRVINLVPSSAAFTANYDNTTPSLGTAAALQAPTTYQVENEGNHTVSFLQGGGAVTSYSGLFQLNDYYTVAITQLNGTYQTFAFSDNSTPTGSGENQLRVVNTLAGATPVDIYATPGASSSPLLINANLIKASVAYGADSGYKTLAPDQYTISITAPGASSSVLFTQTVSVNAAQAETVYAVTSSQSVTGSDDQGG